MKKELVFIGILLMSIGFAAVSTTLIINGITKINENEKEFDVYFSKAEIDGKDESGKVIDESNKKIIYKTKELVEIGEESELKYTVTNRSKNYDAKVKIECTKIETGEITVEPKEMEIEATSEKQGIIRVKKTKNVVEEKEESFECELKVEAKERESLGTNEIKKYNYRARYVTYENKKTGMKCENIEECINRINEYMEE